MQFRINFLLAREKKIGRNLIADVLEVIYQDTPGESEEYLEIIKKLKPKEGSKAGDFLAKIEEKKLFNQDGKCDFSVWFSILGHAINGVYEAQKIVATNLYSKSGILEVNERRAWLYYYAKVGWPSAIDYWADALLNGVLGCKQDKAAARFLKISQAILKA